MPKNTLKNNLNFIERKESKFIANLTLLPAIESIKIIEIKYSLNESNNVYSKLADSYLSVNKYTDAVLVYEKCLSTEGFNKNIFYNLALSNYKLGEYHRAENFAKYSYTHDRLNLKYIKLYLNCLLATKQADLMISISKSALLDFPNNKEFLYLHSQALRLIGDFKSSINILEKLQGSGDKVFYGLALADAYGEIDSIKAINYYEKFLNNDTTFNNTQKYNLSLHYLRSTNFEKGWDLFEFGLDKDTGLFGRKLPYNFTNTYRADKSLINDSKWVMLCAEQGVGDQIIFLSALNEAISDYPKLFFVGEERLFPILRRSFPSITCTSNGIVDGINLLKLESKNGFGYIPLGTLLSKYRPNLNSFLNNKKPYIYVNPDLYSHFRDHLYKIARGKRIIGISWFSNVSKELSVMKNIDFMDWLPIFDNNTLVVNLQYGNTLKEQKLLNDLGLDFISFNEFDFINQLDIWLALSAACDGIVSVSTSLVHFAGSCGQHVSVVMPSSQGHWSLGLKETESILYPNVKIFRNFTDENYSGLILEAASSLRNI